MTPNLQEWMKALGATYDTASDLFTIREGLWCTSMQAAFFHAAQEKAVLEARMQELDMLLAKHLQDPFHELDIPDYVQFHKYQLQAQLTKLEKERSE